MADYKQMLEALRKKRMVPLPVLAQEIGISLVTLRAFRQGKILADISRYKIENYLEREMLDGSIPTKTVDELRA